MDPIEAAARAIHMRNNRAILESGSLRDDIPMREALEDETWESLPPEGRGVLLELARAAIEAYEEAKA